MIDGVTDVVSVVRRADRGAAAADRRPAKQRSPGRRRPCSWVATPGIGKSRLVAELSKRATTAGAVVVTGQCLDVAEGGAPYAPVHEVLAQLGSSGAALRRQAGGGVAGGAAPRRRRAPGRGRRRGRPLGGPLDARPAHRARRRPGATRRDARGDVPRRRPGARRSDARPARRARARRARRAHPSGAVRPRRRRRAAARHPRNAAAGLAGQRRARAIRRQPVLRRGARRRRRAKGSIPPGLHELLLARLDRLDKVAQQVVRAAAVGGRRIGHRLLAAAVELPADVLDAGLAVPPGSTTSCSSTSTATRSATPSSTRPCSASCCPASAPACTPPSPGRSSSTTASSAAAWAAALVHHWTAAGRSDRAVAPALAAAVDAELAYALPEAQRYYDWLLATLDEGTRSPPPTCRCPAPRSSTGRPTSPAAPATSTVPPS